MTTQQQQRSRGGGLFAVCPRLLLLSVVVLVWIFAWPQPVRSVEAMLRPVPPTRTIPPPPPVSMPVWSLAACTDALVQNTKREENDGKNSVKGRSLSLSSFPSTSMNIVTFCTAVSVSPPKLWIISLYHDTLTKDAFLASGRGVLQLLRPRHKELIGILGKRSGYEAGYSKRTECLAKGFVWTSATTTTRRAKSMEQPSSLPSKEIDNYTNQQDVEHLVVDDFNDEDDPAAEILELLPDCALYIHVRVRETMPAGDHVVALCEVTQTSEWDETLRNVVRCSINSNNNGDAGPPESKDTTVASAAATVIIPALDPVSVLYTGQLRSEGIL